MTGPPDDVVLAWSRLVRAHGVALGAVQSALKADGLPPLEWYDVLLELERIGPQRPKDLQRQLLLAQSNLSRLLDRMSAAGLVERREFDGDGRGQLAEVTPAGRKMRARMWPTYAQAIEAAVGAQLTPAEAVQLADLLNRIARPAQTSPPRAARSARRSAP